MAVLPGKGRIGSLATPSSDSRFFLFSLTLRIREQDGKKYSWRGLLIGVLVVAFAMPARADTLQTEGDDIVIAIVVVAVGIVIGTILIIHYSKKRSITGCIMSAPNGMILTDEKDKHTYALSGITAGVKQGDRMKLQGKREKPKDPDKTCVGNKSCG